jgi:Lactate racemase N-terminal domain
MLTVRQHFPDRRLSDIPGAIQRELSAAPFAQNLKPGARIAIAVGSRGIANIATIVRTVVDFWKSRGCRPFIFPSMGSHGAATAEGQADVLAHFGIHEAAMGCPVISALDVVSLGHTPDGIEAFMDKNAYDADGVLVIGRVKWHTDFAGKIESGLLKMIAIGLGKFAGAQRYHIFGYRLGLEHVIRTVSRVTLRSGKILGGLAILEDANHNTAQITAVPIDQMEKKEEELVALTKSWMGRIPVPLNLLIVDEIGKNYSGSGMDCKVVNRGPNGEYNPWDTAPHIDRIFIRGLSQHTYGNGVGIGMADVVNDRLIQAIDWNPTQINSITASTPANSRTPLHFPTDRECIERIWTTTGQYEKSAVTIGWIANSLELGTIRLSENLRPLIEANPIAEIAGEAEPLEFGRNGNLSGLLEPVTVAR